MSAHETMDKPKTYKGLRDSIDELLASLVELNKRDIGVLDLVLATSLMIVLERARKDIEACTQRIDDLDVEP